MIFYKNNDVKVKEMPVSVSQLWFQELLRVLKTWLLDEVFEHKLNMFFKNYFPLPQSIYS